MLIAALLISGLGGCECGTPSDGIEPETKAQLKDINAAATAVNGDYSKLSPEDQKRILDMANGNEEQAKKLCYLMAHPPRANVQSPK